MSKLFEQFKKETGDNWSYKNGWDFAPDEIITQKYIEWLEKKLTSDNSGSSGSETKVSSPKVCPKCQSENYHEETDPKRTELVRFCHDCGQTF